MSETPDPAPVGQPAKKAWVEPELAAFPMSEAESPARVPSGVDFGSNAS